MQCELKDWLSFCIEEVTSGGDQSAPGRAPGRGGGGGGGGGGRVTVRRRASSLTHTLKTTRLQ